MQQDHTSTPSTVSSPDHNDLSAVPSYPTSDDTARLVRINVQDQTVAIGDQSPGALTPRRVEVAISDSDAEERMGFASSESSSGTSTPRSAAQKRRARKEKARRLRVDQEETARLLRIEKDRQRRHDGREKEDPDQTTPDEVPTPKASRSLSAPNVKESRSKATQVNPLKSAVPSAVAGKKAQGPKPSPKPGPRKGPAGAAKPGPAKPAPTPAPPAPNPGKPPGPAPAPPIRVPSKVTVESNLARLRINVAPDDLATQQAFKKVGVPFLENENHNPGGHTHPVSAGVRKYATARALALLHSNGARNVLSVYGSGRDTRIAEFLNQGLPKKDVMKVTIHRPTIVPKDISRTVQGSVQTLTPCLYDGFLLVDIYSAEGGDDLSREFVDNLAAYGPVVWVGHRFDGAFGPIETEGAWMRVVHEDRERILSRPDTSTEPYPLHAPLDWLHASGFQKIGATWLAWTPVNTIGATSTVLFKRVHTALQQTVTVPIEPRYSWVDLPIPANCESFQASLLLRFCPDWVTFSILGHTRVIVDRNIVADLAAQYAGRAFSAYTYRSMSAQVSMVMRALPVYKQMQACFPERFDMVVEYTALAAFIQSSTQRSSVLTSLQGTRFSDDSISYNAAVKGIGEKPRSTRRWVFFVAMAALAAYLLWRNRRRFSRTQSRGAVGDTLVHHIMTAQEIVIRRSSDFLGKTYERIARWADKQILQPLDQVLAVTNEVCYPDPAGPRPPTLFAAGATSFLIGMVLGIAGEEFVKRCHPSAPLCFGLAEVGVKLFNLRHHGVTGAIRLLGLPTLLTVGMHVLTGYMPYKWGFLAHLAWNCGWLANSALLLKINPQTAVPTSVAASKAIACVGGLGMWAVARHEPMTWSQEPWTTFKATYYEAPWESRPRPQDCECPVRLSVFAPEEGVVAKEIVPFFDRKPVDPDMDVRGSLDTTPTAPKGSIYWFLPTSAPAYSPDASDANLWGVVEARTLVDPPMSPRDQRKAWENLPIFASPDVPIQWENHVEAYMRNLEGVKKKRAMHHLELLQQNWIVLSQKEVNQCMLFVKTDELLFQRNAEGGVSMKPRAIINVSPLIQVRVGPEIRELTERLHFQWSWKLKRPFSYQGWTIYLTFGSDATDKKLTRWWASVERRLVPRSLAVIVAGDDSLAVIMNEVGEMTILEGDASMFDQSQAEGPLVHEGKFCSTLGMSDEAVQLLTATAKAPYVVRGKLTGKVLIHHVHRPMRTTGGPNTSSGNSIVMGTAAAVASVRMAVAADINAARFTTEMGKLGFKMKVRQAASIEEATFLKGTWYMLTEGLFWGPLPTRILKMGKSLRDPRAIYHTRDLHLACRKFASDLAVSYRNFVQVPFVREFCENFAGFETGLSVEEQAPWKVAAAYDRSPGAPLDDSMCLRRYGLSSEAIDEMRQLVRWAPLFSFLEHPGFEVIASVDYS